MEYNDNKKYTDFMDFLASWYRSPDSLLKDDATYDKMFPQGALNRQCLESTNTLPGKRT